MALQEALYVIVIAQELERKGISRVFKHQTQLEADPDFVPVIAQFAQTDAQVKMWLPH
jgi:hypothetical protein